MTEKLVRWSSNDVRRALGLDEKVCDKGYLNDRYPVYEDRATGDWYVRVTPGWLWPALVGLLVLLPFITYEVFW